MNKRKRNLLVASLSTMLGAGIVGEGMSNLYDVCFNRSNDRSAEVYQDLKRTIETNLVPAKEVIENHDKYTTLNKLYEEMSEDKHFMAQVKALQEKKNASGYGVLRAVLGAFPLAIGVGVLKDNLKRKK